MADCTQYAAPGPRWSGQQASPLVSIVLPTYNGSRYLRESINSCLDQTYGSWELIIVDDASTDDSAAIAGEYVASDPRIRLVRNATNSKLPRALNIGFSHARGELLSWTSDDNCFRPSALEKLVSHMNQNPSTGFVYSDFTVIDEDGLPSPQKSWAASYDKLPFYNCIGACFLYRRTVHEQIGGYAEDLFLVEDYDYWLRIAKLFRMDLLPEDLYRYRFHGQSLTWTRRSAVLAAIERCLSKHLPTITWIDSRTRAQAYAALVRSAIERKDRFAIISHLLRLTREDPSELRPLDGREIARVLLPLAVTNMLRTANQWRRSLFAGGA